MPLALLLTLLSQSPDAGTQAPPPPAAPPSVTVRISGFKSDLGKAWVLVFKDDAFPTKRDQAIVSRFVPIVGGKATLTFDVTGTEEIAIAVIHDENDNAKLDTNFIGIPNEGLGSTRDAKGFMGPPKWKDAKVRVSNGLTLDVPIRY